MIKSKLTKCESIIISKNDSICHKIKNWKPDYVEIIFLTKSKVVKRKAYYFLLQK